MNFFGMSQGDIVSIHPTTSLCLIISNTSCGKLTSNLIACIEKVLFKRAISAIINHTTTSSKQCEGEVNISSYVADFYFTTLYGLDP